MRIAVLNQKGGTGKTTVAVNLAAGLARRGRRTLLVDLDAGAGVTRSLHLSPERNVYDFVTGAGPAESYAVAVRENLDVIPSEKASTASLEAVIRKDKERLALAARFDGSAYNAVLFDCGPGFNVVNVAAIRAAEKLAVPLTLDYLALTGLAEIQADLEALGEIYGEGRVAELGYIIPCFYDKRRRLTREVLAVLKKDFPGKVTPPIRVSVKLAEAPGHGKTIYEYDRRGRGAEDFNALTAFILSR